MRDKWGSQPCAFAPDDSRNFRGREAKSAALTNSSRGALRELENAEKHLQGAAFLRLASRVPAALASVE